jgi:FdhD protein
MQPCLSRLPSPSTALSAPSPSARWSLPPVDAYATGVSQCAVQRYEPAGVTQHDDCLIEELPVSLEFNEVARDEVGNKASPAHAIVMMATPIDIEAFALGFALTEGVVDTAAQVLDIQVVPVEYGVGVLIMLTQGLLQRVQARQRGKAAASSCGLCGLADMQAALTVPAVAPSAWRTTPAAIASAFDTLPSLQTLGAQTGAAHAAACVDAQGNILAIAEDAGRHNALDKLVGMMAQRGLQPSALFCAITSRASFEMVQKAARVGFPMLCAISAPTALAVRLAQESGITLCGFVRGRRLSCFSHSQRLQVAA